jgi:hypothetical protein
MFRDTKRSEITPKHFGAGSVLKAGNHESYLVVCSGNTVQLLEWRTFELFGKPVPVQDPNFMSQDEVRALTSQTENTFSDFDLLPQGLKAIVL